MNQLTPYLAIQERELQEHKWYLSERAGYDVGMNKTIEDWVITGHAQRFRETYFRHLDNILQACVWECEDIKNCLGIQKCQMPLTKIHSFLED